MRHAHFLVLTGRLNEFPLHELLETLRGQRKTGRLQVEFKAGPCALYFREGALVEAAMGSLRGLEALSLALSLQQEDAAPFNFNPLVAPPPAPGEAEAAEAAAAFARESAAHARAQVIEVEPEPRSAGAAGDGRGEDAGDAGPAQQLEPGASAAQLRAPAASPLLGAPPAEPRRFDRAEAGRPRALLPAAEEGALVERLARIETVVATQARRANVERAVYAALVAALILAAFIWRGPLAAGGDAPERAGLTSPPAAAGRPSDAGRGAEMNADGESRTALNDTEAPTAVDAKPTSSPAAGAAPAEAARLTATAPQAAPTGTIQTAEPAAAKPPARPADARTRQPSSTEPGTRADAGRAAQTDEPARATATRAKGAGGHVVQVRMTIERGRVLRAEVSNPRAGMAAYEALALRMARQRRYPEEFSGQETLRLPVGQ